MCGLRGTTSGYRIRPPKAQNPSITKGSAHRKALNPDPVLAWAQEWPVAGAPPRRPGASAGTRLVRQLVSEVADKPGGNGTGAGLLSSEPLDGIEAGRRCRREGTRSRDFCE